MERVVLGLVVVILLLSAVPSASADPPGPEPAAVPQEQVLVGTGHVLDTGNAVPLSPGEATSTGIAAPQEDGPGAPFVVDAAGGATTGIGLPMGTDEPSRTPHGALVYEGARTDVSVAVRAIDVSQQDDVLAAALQAVIVLESADAPTTYAFPLTPPAGGSVALRPSGAVTVQDRDGVLVGVFTPPWAVDAAGQPVRTWFSLAGDALVQHVEPTDETVFPVAADPFFVVPALVVGGRTLLQIGMTAATRVAASSVATATVAAVARVSPAMLTARPLSLVAKARFDRILPGGVRHYYARGDAGAIFRKITEGGRAVGPSTRVARNGHTATLYRSTSTSVPTIQINTGASIYKVRIVP